MLLVVEHNGPTMMARIGVVGALNRHVLREFDSSRKDTHWGGVSYQCQISPILEVRFGDRMAAIARALARAFPETRIEVETLKTIAMFCGVGLVVLLLLATYGLDLSAGIF